MFLGGNVTDLIPVAAAILTRAGENGIEILSARRAPGERFENEWEFPGGKFEPDETSEMAVRRELQEELGVDLVLGELLEGDFEGGWDMGNGYVLYPYFAQIAPGQTPVLGEMHSEFQWLPLRDAESVDWVIADLPPLRAAVARLMELSEPQA
jgi:8-oxo-dGTP diphosphatase